MMATEATSDNFVDPPTIISEPLTNAEIENDASELQINGEAKIDGLKPDAELPEGAFSSTEVSVSGGSDTEATKAETSKSQNDEKGHVRTSSTVNKPKSFKAVSVNKTFLAAKGATGATTAKPGEKGAASSATLAAAPSTSSTPRPRLVAKTASGLRDSAPRTSAAINGGKLGSGPDASAVWNKNRPAPPPEQKRITDEELKQQYGIHLATRLQSDDPGRQANWADIDDDDDDWAPESIEWTDGTKITLPQAEESTQNAAKAVPTSLASDSATASPKPQSPAPQPLTVRLGGISGSGKGLVLKGAAEKPTLVAKPPGPPTPVKSPWAPLPPVDRVAPNSAELQQTQQPQQNRLMQRDSHGVESLPPPPAKEIAADDFSRSWREGNTTSNTNRELFNSQSGRYEPVNDARRGSSRNDMHSRQPALLQRPSHHDQPEPSPAFQTHRASGQEGVYGRRRTSSNVSGGSGNFVRRMSKGQEMLPPHDLFGARRGSLVVTTEDPSSPRNYSPSGLQHSQRGHSQQWQARASPVISHASPASAHGQMAGPGAPQPLVQTLPLEDEFELQKKIMRETRELARKRRLEEEAREEAEKKERIRLKLEAMGPPPETKKSKKETLKEEKVVPTQIQAREPASTSIVLPKPPVAEVAGEVKQYGMMKVHPPEPLSLASTDLIGNADSTRPVSLGNRTNSVQSESSETTGPSQQLSGDSRQSQSWQNSAPSGQDHFSTWVSPSVPVNQGRNVWGPPTNDRTLGNGTFNPELSLHGSQSAQMANTGPGPIGPPNPNRANGYQGRVREQYGQRPSPIGPPQRHQGLTRQDPQRAQATSAWNALPEKLAQEDAEQAKQPAAQREVQEAGVDPSVNQPVFKDTWRQVSLGEDGTRSGIQTVSQAVSDTTSSNPALTWKNFPSKLAQDEAAERAVLEQQAAVRRQLESSGLRKDVVAPVYKDTWRQVQLENGVRSEVLSSTTVNSGTSTASSSAVRGSRFFPQSRDVRLEDPNSTSAPPGSSSPPPPTMADHPAYDGDSSHPHVHLPHWPPVVKLPPPKVLAPIGPPKPAASFAAAVAAPSASSSDVANMYSSRHQDARFTTEIPLRQTIGPAGGDNWQDRINHLIGRKTSPPKTHVLAVDSASKRALELPSIQMSATVSFPGFTTGDITEDDGAIESKPMAEECFEEQEMGSLPNIRVPNKAPEAAWQLSPTPSTKFSRKFAVSDTTSSESFVFSPQVTNNGFVIHIMIPGMIEEKCANITRPHEPRQKSNGRRSGSSRGGPSRHASSSYPRGGRPRDTPTSFSSPHSESGPASPSPSSSSRGVARGRVGYTGTWNTHRHTPAPNSAINV